MADSGSMLSSILDDLLDDDPETDLGGLVNEETPHLPVIILIDTSASMAQEVEGKRNIDRVNDALRQFVSDVEVGATDLYKKIRECGDFCVISYGHAKVDIVLPWTHGTQLRAAALPALQASGDTPMHRAIITAGDMMLERLRGYKRDDIEAYCGAVFNLTDGEPTDGAGDNGKERRRARKVVELFETGTSTGKPLAEFHHVGVPGYDRDKLAELSIRPERVTEIGVEITDFFRYIVITFSGIAGAATSAAEHADWRAQKMAG